MADIPNEASHVLYDKTMSNPHAKKPLYNWYETDTAVGIDVLINNVTLAETCVKFDNDSVYVNAKFPSGEQYSLYINLAGSINVHKCSYRVKTVKIVIKLAKTKTGMWNSLQRSVPFVASSTSNGKNWDSITKGIDEEVEGDAVSGMFKKIFASGSDDVKRAMMKSYYESGGTVLSTNWDEVKRGTVEIKEPEGVEYRKWN